MILDGQGWVMSRAGTETNGVVVAAGLGGAWAGCAAQASGLTDTALTPFDMYILSATRDVVRRTHLPARTLAVSVQVGIKHRMAQYYLRRLEERGAVCRPSGAKSGYVINPYPPAPGERTPSPDITHLNRAGGVV